MKIIAQIISWIALVGIIAPPVAFLSGSVPLDQVKLWMLIATVCWFVTVPIWMGRKQA